MVLTDQEAIERIRRPYCEDEIKELQKQTKELRAFVTGENAKQYLTDLPQFERDELRAERMRVMTSAVPIISSTIKPRNRIFSAKGGVEHFIITDKNKETEFRSYIDKLANGLSLKQWIQQFAIRRNDYDPNGIILVEKDNQGKVYPCFISILDIQDRVLCGRTPEYLIIKLNKKQIDRLKRDKIIDKKIKETTEIYRVIDDESDRLFYKDKVIPNTTFKSFSKGVLPAIVSSNIPSDEEGQFYSPLQDAIELIRKHILHESLYNVTVARQAFPKEFMQKFKCPHCDGNKFVNSVTCSECNGSGVMLSQKHSDVLIVDWADENNKGIPNPPMGNVGTQVDTLEFLDDDVEKISDKIYYIVWGMYRSDKISSIRAGVTREAVGSNVEPTAYQAMLNSQPMVTQLVEFSKWYIGIYEFIANIIGYAKLGDEFKGSVIVGGDRFMIESPDATWDRYLKAVQGKAPLSELDSILSEYIENKYCNNPILYRRYTLLLGVEPFIHFDVDQVLSFNIPYIQKMEKVYYNSWKNSLTDWEFVQIAEGLNEAEDDEEDDDEEENNAVKNLKDSLREFTIAILGDTANMIEPPLPESLQSKSPKGKNKNDL